MLRTIRIIHADDHSIVRNTISNILARDTENMEVVAQAASYDELYRVLADNPAEVLLLDGAMIGGSIDENLPQIRMLYPQIKIILLWLGVDVDSLARWVHLLDGQLNLSTNIETLIEAIETVSRGEKYFTLPISRGAYK